ncbi:hypothetical protein IP69_21070 [Bosea sp. AAP35]|nr:hypothetical protein IP69_21070 [Bosea sp. AAP35]
MCDRTHGAHEKELTGIGALLGRKQNRPHVIDQGFRDAGQLLEFVHRIQPLAAITASRACSVT